MYDRNILKVYSPNGETVAEVTALNAHDLVTHHNWTYNNVVAAATPAPPPPPAPVVAPTPATAPVVPVTTPEVAAPADEAPKARLTVEDFADLADKKDVFAYIEATFPGNKLDGRANRDKLIAYAIELAIAAAE